MRKPFVLLCFALQSFLPAAFAQSTQSPLVGNLLEPASAEATSAPLGDFLWQGIRYKNATASLVDADTIRVSGTATGSTGLGTGSSDNSGKSDGSGTGEIKIPWAKATIRLKTKLSLMREALIERNSQADAQKAGGLENVAGKLLRRTASGFLLDDGQGTVVHVKGPMSLTDGVAFKGKLRRSGSYEYTAKNGAVSTIRNYVPAE